MTKTTDRIEKGVTYDEPHYEKCFKCGKQLENWKKTTQVVYCHVCDEGYCIDCWYSHREEENQKANENRTEK